MDFKSKFIANFIDDDRWKYIWNGLGVTLKVTFFAVLLGIAIGVLVAIIRSTHEKNSKSMRMGFGKAGHSEYHLQSISDGNPWHTCRRPADDYVLYHSGGFQEQSAGGDAGVRYQLGRVCCGDFPQRHYVDRRRAV